MNGNCNPRTEKIAITAMKIDMASSLIENRKSEAAKGAHRLFPRCAGQAGHQAAMETILFPFWRKSVISLRTARK